MAGQLNGRQVAILAADGAERVELEQPRRALDDAGARTDLLSIRPEGYRMFKEKEEGCVRAVFRPGG